MITVKINPIKTPLEHHLSRWPKVATGASFFSSFLLRLFPSAIKLFCEFKHQALETVAAGGSDHVTLSEGEADGRLSASLCIGCPAGSLRRPSSGTLSAARAGGIISGGSAYLSVPHETVQPVDSSTFVYTPARAGEQGNGRTEGRAPVFPGKPLVHKTFL